MIVYEIFGIAGKKKCSLAKSNDEDFINRLYREELEKKEFDVYILSMKGVEDGID